MPDHIHLFISAPPTIAPTEIVKILKSVSANEIFKAFPNLKKKQVFGKWIVEQRILCWYCWSSEFGDNNKVYTEPKELRELGVEPTPLKYLHPQAQGTVVLRIKSIKKYIHYNNLNCIILILS